MEENLHIRALHRLIEIQEASYAKLELLCALLSKIPTQKIENNHNTLNDLIDGVDVKSLLKISDRTLYRIKKSHLVSVTRIGKRDSYSRSEIQKVANFFKK